MKIYKVSFVWLLFLKEFRIKCLRRNNIDTKLPSATQEEKNRVKNTTAPSLLERFRIVSKDVSTVILLPHDPVFRGFAMAFETENYDSAPYSIPVYSDLGRIYSRAPSFKTNVLCR